MTGNRPAGHDLPQHFADQMGQLVGPDFPAEIGVAVSGGGDSMVMLHLAAGWARVYGVGLRVATVDHGLRAESAAEAQMVADEAAVLGVSHRTLSWTGWDGSGNLQDAARRARLALLGEWIGPHGHVLMAHTQDDQAETVMMRLLRGSGVDGLAGMAARRRVDDRFTVLRPLLGVPRAQLRHYAKVLRIPYVDDPSNDDPRFARVQIRQQMAALGVNQSTLTDTADRMARASEALRRRAHDVATRLLRDDPRLPGVVVLDRDGFSQVETDTQLRILAAALQYVATATYRPRAAALGTTLDTVLAGGTAPMHGGIVTAKGDAIYIAREHKAVADLSVAVQGQVTWDSRWQVSGAGIQGLCVRPLGEGGLLSIAADMRHGLPRAALASLPAIWDSECLIACAPLEYGPAYQCSLAPLAGNFPSTLLTH